MRRYAERLKRTLRVEVSSRAFRGPSLSSASLRQLRMTPAVSVSSRHHPEPRRRRRTSECARMRRYAERLKRTLRVEVSSRAFRGPSLSSASPRQLRMTPAVSVSSRHHPEPRRRQRISKCVGMLRYAERLKRTLRVEVSSRAFRGPSLSSASLRQLRMTPQWP
jgi:stress-induced morphogen